MRSIFEQADSHLTTTVEDAQFLVAACGANPTGLTNEKVVPVLQGPILLQWRIQNS